MMNLQLQGPRILLRPLGMSDVQSVYKHARCREISRWTFIPHPYRMEHAEYFLKMVRVWHRKKLAQHFGIILAETGELIGVIAMFDLDLRNKRTEIGYWLGKAYWGQGLASEAVRLIVHYCFDELKLHRVYAHVFTGNAASERLLLRIGFQWEGMERESRLRRGRWMDSILYGLLKSDYQRRRTRRGASLSQENARK